MKVKLSSYKVKNEHNRGSKRNYVKTIVKPEKRLGGVKDKRKYLTKTAMSEADSISQRIAVENMRRKSVVNSKKSNSKSVIFGNGDDDWENDPFIIKAKQVNVFDEGLEESSEDDDEDDEFKVSKHFSNLSKAEKMEQIIRNSKLKKLEKENAKEHAREQVNELNNEYRTKFIKVLKEVDDKSKVKAIENDNLSQYFLNLSKKLCHQPKSTVNTRKLVDNADTPENKKTVDHKLNKLRGQLEKAGIELEIKDNESDSESNYDNDMDDNDEEESDDNDEEKSDDNDEEKSDDNDDGKSDDNDEEESDDDNESDIDDVDIDAVEIDDTEIKEKRVIISEDEKGIESENDTENDDISDEEMSDESIEEGDEFMKSVGDENTVQMKALFTQSDVSDSNTSNKTEINVLRSLLQMEEFRGDALLMLSSMIEPCGVFESDILKKLALATVFQEGLQINTQQSYSPELIRFAKFVLQHSTQGSNCWLSISKSVDISKNQLLSVCPDRYSDKDVLAISVIFHTCRILRRVVDNCKNLPSKLSVFSPINEVIKKLPIDLYPFWLKDEISFLTNELVFLFKQDVSDFRIKKVFKIVKLLEPDLCDKFDQTKDIRKSLTKQIKKERRAAGKEIKIRVQNEIQKEVAQKRIASATLRQKTKEIFNSSNQF